MVGLTSDNLRLNLKRDVDWVMKEEKQANQLKAARFAMHKVRLKMIERIDLSPEEGRAYYIAAMKNYDDMIAAAESGCFTESMDREMAEFDINKAFE